MRPSSIDFKTTPLVSIVICTFNRKQMLMRALASVIAQTYSPVEILVLDDGSTDGTLDLMDSFSGRVRYIYQENQGIARARTNACRNAQGEFIAFLDDDDLMPPERISTLLKAIKKFPSAVLAVGDWAEIDNDNNLTGRRWLPGTNSSELTLYEDGYTATLWPQLPIVPHTTLFRKTDGERIGWFDNRYRYASEDKDFFARLAKLGPIVHVSDVVSYYRRGQASLTSPKSRVACSQVIFFMEQIQQISKSGNVVLLDRLKARLLAALKTIALENQTPPATANYLSATDFAAAIGYLSFEKKIDFYYSVEVKGRVKRLLKKTVLKLVNLE